MRSLSNESVVFSDGILPSGWTHKQVLQHLFCSDLGPIHKGEALLDGFKALAGVDDDLTTISLVPVRDSSIFSSASVDDSRNALKNDLDSKSIDDPGLSKRILRSDMLIWKWTKDRKENCYVRWNGGNSVVWTIQGRGRMEQADKIILDAGVNNGCLHTWTGAWPWCCLG